MYVPKHFDESRVPVLHEAIRRIGFGTLVTLGSEGLEASHIPMLIDPEPAPFGTLRGHVARANPQWKRAAAGTPALAMFLGSIALRRHVRVAAQPKQTITLGRLLVNPSFSAYAFDNARAKVLDQELRETLTRLKEGLLVNRDIREAETFEL